MKRLIARRLMWLSAVAVLYGNATVALATPVYTITNHTIIDLTVDPLSTAQSGSAYYNYDLSSASGNPAFGPVSNTGFFWLHEDTTSGDISLGMIFDAPDNSGGKVNLGLSGVPSSSFVSVADDFKDAFSTSGGDWKWFDCCTDGGVLGGLGGLWDISLTLNSATGMDQWVFLSGSPTSPVQTLLNMGHTLVISATDPSAVPPTSSTPEPGTWILLGTGLAGLLGYGWWKRR